MNIFQSLWLYWKGTLPLNMKYNFIQMTSTAGCTIPHSINPIFQYIFHCMGAYFIDGNFDFMF